MCLCLKICVQLLSIKTLLLFLKSTLTPLEAGVQRMSKKDSFVEAFEITAFTVSDHASEKQSGCRLVRQVSKRRALQAE